ncbi:DUF3311 domain-containing protein [Paraburkholderia bannensis]|uniref:DUF3311 domain-containing protein n=1 Tax=Paraburkholderia bannensis TaxID=765414 RepID=UPI002ABD1572|nr:DUF3311 domain-containing protein [Paraburkholderia bannensis]
MKRLILGLGLPFIAIVVMLPMTQSLHFSVLGVPFVYFWLFSWLFLTSGCLFLCWYFFDRETISEAQP